MVAAATVCFGEVMKMYSSLRPSALLLSSGMGPPTNVYCCEAQARVRQGSARDGSQGERPQSLNPCLELTLKLVATTHHHPKFNFT